MTESLSDKKVRLGGTKLKQKYCYKESDLKATLKQVMERKFCATCGISYTKERDGDKYCNYLNDKHCWVITESDLKEALGKELMG